MPAIPAFSLSSKLTMERQVKSSYMVPTTSLLFSSSPENPSRVSLRHRTQHVTLLCESQREREEVAVPEGCAICPGDTLQAKEQTEIQCRGGFRPGDLSEIKSS